MSDFRVQIAATVDALTEDWPRLDRPGPGAHLIFQTADFIAVWADTIGAARRVHPLFIRIEKDGALLMLLALGLEQRRGARVLTFLDGGVSDYNAPILFPAAQRLPAAAAPELWRSILAALPDFDAAILEKMPAQVNGVANPLFALSEDGASAPSGHVIPLQGSWDDFVAQRLHRPKDSKRKRRRLAEAGAVRMHIAQSQADVDRIFPVLIKQKTRRYLELNGEDGFERPGYRRYFAEITAQLFPRGVAHLSALEVAGEILATHWGLVHGGRFYCLMLAYADHPLARFSPGRLLVEDLVAWSFAQGLTAFDLGVGDTEWKHLFQPERLPLAHASLAGNALGWAYLEARKLRDRLARGRDEQAA
jgi:CelD/BcsL family acetyltransferase involved in cellulose biosynthesis